MSRKLFNKMTTIMMSQKMADDLEKIAKDDETTMSNIIRLLIKKEFERRGVK